jgi:kumamolisin
MSDLQKYFADQKLQVPKISTIRVDNEAETSADPENDQQVEMDIEIAGSVAPKAEFVVYRTNNTDQGFADAIQAAAHDTTHHLSALAIGWGGPEVSWTSQSIQRMDSALRQATQAGITVVVAAGDSGASDGVGDGKAHVDFPASSPWVVSVGGTRLVTVANSIASEVVWNDPNTAGATGGGVSALFPQPEWQARVSVPRRLDGSSGRGVPDVAADASPSTAYELFLNGKTTVIGGTSATTPFWAGLIAILDQGVGRRVGFLNPFLYQHAGPSAALRAIITGDNTYEGVRGFAAGRGWSAVTGWGSPDGKKLLAALQAMPRTGK